jgi:poly-gamma-glutamate capsule biosynthesis protein CapA/YwtB (metallophosphatase superfamily)
VTSKDLHYLSSSDLVCCNVETLFHRFERPPAAVSGGLYMQAGPEVADTLSALNIQLASIANNHSCDYGADGLLESRRTLEAAGVHCSGGGANLTEARAPAVAHLHGSSVALVSATSTFPEHARASNASGPIMARPGISSLRFATLVTVTPEQMQTVERIFSGIALRQLSIPPTLHLPHLTIATADNNGVVTIPHAIDVSAIAAVVRQARAKYDVVLVSLHAHEGGHDDGTPPGFLCLAARFLADAGATAVMCHGPHVSRGIEVRNGALIFYSLGNFFFEFEYITSLPPDALDQVGLPPGATLEDYLRQRASLGGPDFFANRRYWESFVAIVEIADGEITDVVLHPIELGFGREDGSRGRPRSASADSCRSILNSIKLQSEVFGTKITGRSVGRVVL